MNAVYYNHNDMVYNLIDHCFWSNRRSDPLSRQIFEDHMYFLILIYSLEGRENPINTYVMNIHFPVRIYNYKYRIVLNLYSLVLGDFEYSFSRVIILDYASGQVINLLSKQMNMQVPIFKLTIEIYIWINISPIFP